MKKIVLLAAMLVIFCLSSSLHLQAMGQNNTSKQDEPASEIQEYNEMAITTEAEQPEISRIDSIQVHVRSCEVTIAQGTDPQITETFPAATVSWEMEGCISYGRVGHIYKIIFNPTWTPTPKMMATEFKGKKKFTVLPGKNNPLGIVKFYIQYGDYESLLGMHSTNQPGSIGKPVSHGCTRFLEENALKIARIILRQNGYDDNAIDAMIAEAKANPRKTMPAIILKDRPTIIHTKD